MTSAWDEYKAMMPVVVSSPSEKHSEAPTPRTDEATQYGGFLDDREAVDANFARQLERELAEAQEVANRETMSAAYWKDKAQSASVPTAWIATSPSGAVLHMSTEDGWKVEPVAVSSGGEREGQC